MSELQTTEKACIQALELAEYRLGHEPTKGDYEGLDIYPSANTIIRVCGSWNEAKEKAGMTANLKNRTKRPDHMRKQYDKADCIEAVKKADEQSPYQNLTAKTYDELREDSDPSSSVIRSRLGNWPDIREQFL